MATITQLDLSLAQGKTGSFTAPAAATSTSTVAVFTINSSATSLGDVSPAYKLTNVGSSITYINGGNTTHGWNIDATALTGTATIKGGDYNDFIKIKSGGTVITGLGKDTVDITTLANAATLTDYTYGSDVIVVGNVTANPESLIGADGKIEGNGASIQLNATSGYYKATLTDGTNAVNVWKGSTSAQTLDGSSETDALLMVAGASSDTLIGGSKADNIYATTEGAYAFGGAGTDSIILTADTKREYVALSTDSGKDSVINFEQGFADSDDVLVLRDGSISDLKLVAGTDSQVKLGSGNMQLNNVVFDNNTSLQLLIQDSTGTVSKVAGVVDGSTYAAGNGTADYYISSGKTGKVDFSNVSDDVVVELSNAGNYEDNATFVGIDSVAGGTGNTTLVGSADTKNYLAAGTGKTTLWGGGSSNDTLVGDNGTNSNAFFVGQYDGKDTIQNFKAGLDAETKDTLYMLNSPVASLKNDGANIAFTFADGSGVTLLQKGGAAANTAATGAIRFSLDGSTIQTAVVGQSTAANTFTYSSDVNMYFGGSQTDALNVADADYDKSTLDVRLNNTVATQTYSSVERVNASGYSGTAFISGSDESAEDLIGGTGKTTIWGGLGAANDTLRGTNGDVTSFYFGKNNGADLIVASDSDDKVVFYDFANTDLTAIDTTGSQLKFTFNDGSSLQIQNYTTESVQTFEFNNSSWTYSKETKTFTQTK